MIYYCSKINLIKIPLRAKTVEIGKNRKAGRPIEAASALLRQEQKKNKKKEKGKRN